MAPTLSSSAFITPQHSLTLRNPRLSVHAAKNGPPGSFPSFRLGKFGAGSSSDEEASQGGDTGNSTPSFSFNFGKLSSDAKSLVPVLSNPASGLSFGQSRKKDTGTVFVAGATGQAGIRIAQTLLREGFSVRAGVPDLGSAQELARLAAAYKLISNEESKRLNAVESTFQDAESIAKAIGNASKVVVTIGQAENGPAGEVTTSDALQVIEAAQLAGVSHVAIVYDGSISTASTYNVLDGIQSFFNNFFSRSQPLTVSEFLQKVVATDVSYTLMKTSLTDDYSPEGSFNVVVSAEGSAADSNDYKVSTSKIASLVANVFSNTWVAENKVVEVSSDPSAKSKSADELFSAIPQDGRRKVYLEALEKAKAEELERKATEQAVQAAKKKEEKVKKIEEEEEEEVESNGGVSVESLLGKAKGFGSGLSWEKFSSQLSAAAQKQVDEKPKAQIATVRGQAKARNLPSKKAVIKPPPTQRNSVFSRPKSEPKAQPPIVEKKEVRKVFGGLFKQETIYVDDV